MSHGRVLVSFWAEFVYPAKSRICERAGHKSLLVLFFRKELLFFVLF
jgi:hypothetical protein